MSRQVLGSSTESSIQLPSASIPSNLLLPEDGFSDPSIYDVTVYGGAQVILDAAPPSPTEVIPDWAQFVLDVSWLLSGYASPTDAPSHISCRKHAFPVHRMEFNMRSERARRRWHTVAPKFYVPHISLGNGLSLHAMSCCRSTWLFVMLRRIR